MTLGLTPILNDSGISNPLNFYVNKKNGIFWDDILNFKSSSFVEEEKWERQLGLIVIIEWIIYLNIDIVSIEFGWILSSFPHRCIFLFSFLK